MVRVPLVWTRGTRSRLVFQVLLGEGVDSFGGTLDGGEDRLGLRGVGSGVQRFGYLVEVVPDLPEVPPQREQLPQHLFPACDVRGGAVEAAGSAESRVGKEPGHAQWHSAAARTSSWYSSSFMRQLGWRTRFFSSRRRSRCCTWGFNGSA
ncbi:hypothetical protein AB0L74_12895 [Streptomyces sp. NPDC052020]|uniref:hypothetical protein n=1 Tax=Streptomyces sp. NPDC052020 TaxID=3155677 RepID=UPI0034435950